MASFDPAYFWIFWPLPKFVFSKTKKAFVSLNLIFEPEDEILMDKLRLLVISAIFFFYRKGAPQVENVYTS